VLQSRAHTQDTSALRHYRAFFQRVELLVNSLTHLVRSNSIARSFAFTPLTCSDIT
jgi:hypothetical protein